MERERDLTRKKARFLDTLRAYMKWEQALPEARMQAWGAVDLRLEFHYERAVGRES
jgi:hypothetical protein